MFAVGLLQWWYGAGIKTQFIRAMNRVAEVYDYFSIDLLLRSLFAPFRQISAGSFRGSLEIQLRAFIDRLISRTIGAIMRTILIVIGTVSVIFMGFVFIVWLMVWIILPVLPFIGIVLTLIGWVPWKI